MLNPKPNNRLISCAVALSVAAGAFAARDLCAQSVPDPLWLDQFGTDNSDAPSAAVSDAEGVFIFGSTHGSLGGPNAGGEDYFLARYDTSGAQQWVRQFGTAANDWPRAAAPDGGGGIFLAGRLPDWPILMRFDHDGDQVWSTVPWTASGTHIAALAPDGDGGFFAAGGTDGVIGAPSAGGRDVIVARFDSAGALIWVRQFGSAGNDVASAAAPDGAGGVYIAGVTNGNIARPPVGFDDAWLARYDSQGNQLWVRQFGDNSADGASSLAPDGAGGIFIAGQSGMSTVFGFLARYDSAGMRHWITSISTGMGDYVGGLAPDGRGGVYIGGSTRGLLGGHSTGTHDIYLSRYAADGDLLWTNQFGTTQTDSTRALAWDHLDGVYIAGTTNGSLTGIPTSSGSDAFVARFPGTPAPAGACCMHDGSCEMLNAYRCTVEDGVYQGDYIPCGATPCRQPGACCLPMRCDMLSEIQCADRGGLYRGDGHPCETARCPTPAGEQIVVPNGFENTGGDSSSGAMLNRVPATFQTVYAASQIAIPAGSLITGFTGRLSTWAASGPWPAVPATFSMYDVQLSVSLNPPGSLSTSFAENIGADAVLVRSGPLTIPALWFPGGAASPTVNDWGNDIEFTNPYIYSGGDLLITIRHSGNNTGTWGSLDSISPSHPMYGTVVSSLYAASASAHAGSTTVSHIIGLTYRPPSCYANCDQSTTPPILNIDDFLCFISAFAAASALPHEEQIGHYANCDQSTTSPVLNVDDFTCFIAEFAAGCP